MGKITPQMKEPSLLTQMIDNGGLIHLHPIIFYETLF